MISLLLLSLLVGVSADESAVDRLRVDVKVLSTTYADRDPTHPEVYAAVADFVQSRLEDAGCDVVRETFVVDEQECHNLIVDLPGEQGDLPPLVVGAHYDAVPTSPGADDNATGVAAALELARRLVDEQRQRPLRLIFWANEEPPYFRTEHMGSVVNAKATRAGGEELMGVISLDMLGYFDAKSGSQRMPEGMELPGIDPADLEVADFIAAEGEPMSSELLGRIEAAWDGDVRLVAVTLPEHAPVGGLSDHWSYQRAGYPGVILTDTSFLRNPHYHRSDDKPATLDFPRYVRVVDGVEDLVRKLTAE